MTREKAIEFGNMWLEINEDYKDSDTYAFFAYTVKALKQESLLDKIRAEIMDTGAFEQEVMGYTEFLAGINYCLGVIDKYKAESGGD